MIRRIAALLIFALLVGHWATAYAEKPQQGSVSVSDGVYGGYVDATATVPPLPKRSTSPYVLGFCYQNGEGVWGAYYEVIDGKTTLGPLSSSIWPGGAADCKAELGYFTREGFGRWVVLATDTFSVTDSSSLDVISLAAASTKNSVSVSNLRGDFTVGGVVTVDIEWKLSGNNWPMAVAQCYQNGESVYAGLDGPGRAAPASGTSTVSWQLGGGASDWLNNGGGPASCEIQAFSYGYSKGYQKIVPYNVIYFEAV